MRVLRKHHLDWQIRQSRPQESVNLDSARAVHGGNFEWELPGSNCTFSMKTLGWGGNGAGLPLSGRLPPLISPAQITKFVSSCCLGVSCLCVVIQLEILFHVGSTSCQSFSILH